ncbi:Rep protein [Ralstonia solanacearum]|uniref:rolling circle replication-associated protein n=1 Tax=Ralstonia solanacearum TaxID=305 RepID=UPI0023052A4E|nr:Rep protein [Ralstonia solanacearum]MDB0564657.1 Rep protein [Ralstonia solanacearum]MDB0577159.1 Rep protein [Ralstonia solanacearum]
MRETTIAENYDYGQAAIWGSDAHRASVEVRKIEREESDAELWAEGPARHDMVAKVRAFEDGSVEFSGYRRTVVQRLNDLRDLPRRARGAKPENEDDKEARAASVKSAAKRAKQNVRLRCKTARVTHMITLTTRECITDLDRFLGLWDAFRRAMARYSQFHYIAVPELQKRGAWHMHVAVSGRVALNLARRVWLKVVGGRGKGYCHIRNPQGAHFGKQWKLDALASYVAKYIGKDIAETRFNKKKYYTSRGINVPEAVVYAIENSRSDCADALKDVLTTLCAEFDIADIRCFVALDGSSYFASASKAVLLAA